MKPVWNLVPPVPPMGLDGLPLCLLNLAGHALKFAYFSPWSVLVTPVRGWLVPLCTACTISNIKSPGSLCEAGLDVPLVSRTWHLLTFLGFTVGMG
jgi:hypothetical protein